MMEIPDGVQVGNRVFLLSGVILPPSLSSPRKVGGGYIFVHRLLQEYFAAMSQGR